MFEWPLIKANQIRSQQQRQRGWKLYSFHAPEVECIGKGKASAPYEFGVKVSIVTTNARSPGGQFVPRAKALSGNPYDGHTLAPIIAETQSSPVVPSSAQTRDTEVTIPRSHTASSSRGRSAVSSAQSNASSNAVQR